MSLGILAGMFSQTFVVTLEHFTSDGPSYESPSLSVTGAGVHSWNSCIMSINVL